MAKDFTDIAVLFGRRIWPHHAKHRAEPCLLWRDVRFTFATDGG
ncbi:Uncharacterised protein [Raoultella planticola]|uniref:Uncharacterized protein n=1 Tax=Raoultella planticola TaxID=575 RepID=A0A485A3Z4_RAOPL|nr:Uncharacterised protein [Raoultella planticola]